MAAPYRWLGLSLGSLVLFCNGMAWSQTAQKAVKPKEAPPNSSFFPDWPTEAFDFEIGPILGVRTQQTKTNDVLTDVVSSEIGLGARVQGIPLVPGNPGVTLQPYAHYTWGNRTEKIKGAALDQTESSGFQRSWYGVLGRFYYQSFRYSLDLGQGQILHDEDIFSDLASRRIVNDFAVLILPFLSAHYTLTSFTVTLKSESKPSIEELDHWLHGRVAFSLFAATLDFGPGLTVTQYSARNPAEAPLAKFAELETSYLKALASMHIFWRLGLSASAKYILKAQQKDGLDLAIEQLPNENLAQRKSFANLPDGSLEATAFFGLKNLFGGFGIGWQYYYLEAAGNPKQISRNQSVGIVYEGEI